MNLKTTVVLAILVAAGGAGWWLWHERQPQQAESATVALLENDLTAAKLMRIEIVRGSRHVLLERKPGQEWTLPGQWPVRKPEVEQLVRLLANLRTRFEAIALDNPPNLKQYGLDRDPLIVKVNAGGKDHSLTFGEEPGESNRFSRPTYIRVDDKAEVVRLAPGLVAELDRPEDYYMQRRLFPAERVTSAGESGEKVEQLAAREIIFKGAGDNYTVARAGSDWELREPFRDRPDPDKLKKILAAIPDIWAEQFVDKKDKKLDDFGLQSPAEKLQVTLANGGKVTLLVGKQSQMKTRMIMKPSPPFGPPQPPRPEIIHEEYRFAKFGDNAQIFEIRADTLKEIAVPAAGLRDARLARFKTDDVRRLELKDKGKDIVLVKDKEQWRLQQPGKVDAEAGKVTELLDKLAGLEAKDADVIEKGDPKAYGLEKPAVVTVAVEETQGTGEKKTTQKRVYTFDIGKHDKDKKKLYVKLAGWPRINAVDDNLEKLLDRPPLAYRSRKVLDYPTADLARIEIKRPGETFALEQVKNAWRLAAPVHADVDETKADTLAGDLARLEAVEFVTDNAKADDLDKLYGLGKSAVSAKLVFTDAKKPAQTLLIGKQRDGKQENFAKLESEPAIFVVKKETREQIERDSLAYRPQQLWKLSADSIAELRVHKQDADYRLKREGAKWNITGPFDAAATPGKVQPMAEELANLRCERYVANTTKDLGAYGLDKPYLRVAVVPSADKKDTKEAKEKAKQPKEDKERVVLVGKPADKDGKDAKARYARLGDSEAIFILSEKSVAALDHRAVDLLDGNLLATSADTIQRISKTGAGGPWTVQKEKGQWWVTETQAVPFAADKDEVMGLVDVLAHLRAKEFAAYGPKADLAAFGLDKPAVTITFTAQPPAEKDKSAKPATHTLVLGKPVKDAATERYARLDFGPGVAVLDAATVNELTRNYLEFVNHQLLKLDGDQVTTISRQMGGETVDLVKRDGKWRLVKPADAPADQNTVDDLLKDLANLRAKRIAAFPVKPAELKSFGLEPATAVVTIRVSRDKGKPEEHRLHLGSAPREEGKPVSGDRFARVDGSPTIVAIVADDVARRLLASALQFRDHDLAKLDAVDRLTLERGQRKAVFARTDDTWKMTEPVQAPTEQADLEKFVKSLSHLRADELVAERSTDSKYGLERPQARWIASAGGKEVLNLLVGAHEKGIDNQTKGIRCYARLAKGDLIFLLSSELTAKALGEYRDRKVFASLDAAQVEKIRFGYDQGPFALTKVDNTWQVEGNGKAKVKEEAVRDLLARLAKLRADRYVVDKGADLKLYGLQPSFLALDIRTPTSTYVLHIGNKEGDSNRYYATVPGTDAGAVLVIDADDSHQLVRTLAAYIEKAASK